MPNKRKFGKNIKLKRKMKGGALEEDILTMFQIRLIPQ